jgi:hypothetical protein
VPNDLSKIKSKLAFNLTKRQILCFGGAALIGIPAYFLLRSIIGNTAALFLMIAIMLPAFLLAMYEKDGLPFEKVLRNIIRSRFIYPSKRPYQTDNFYSSFVNKDKEVHRLAKDHKKTTVTRKKR